MLTCAFQMTIGLKGHRGPRVAMPGRKKTKRFIDKKNATTYKLVHRSQKDVLANDPHQPQMVLHASADSSGGLATSRRKEEQEKYGIYFDDDYDYLQHLQEPGSALPELSLPSELFGSEVTAAEKLNRVLPTEGPRPDWDPDIVAALDHAEEDEEEGDLEDDFVMLANGEEGSENTKDESSSTADHLWWTARGDFLPPEVPAISHLTHSDSSQEDEDSEVEEMEEEFGTRRTARFTEYSISSSVVPRNKGLTLLDERFEELMCEYNDEDLGALEEEQEEESAETEEMLLNAAVTEFERHHQDKIVSWSNIAAELGKCTADGSLRERDRVEEDLSSCSSHDEDTSKPRERWDCESILSTYSNIYNHPKLITEPAPTKRKIKLSHTTGFPAIETLSLNTDTSSQVDDQRPSSIVTTSRKNETHEEKQRRKKAIKEERKERRADKKATKMAFRSHRLQQEKLFNSSGQSIQLH